MAQKPKSQSINQNFDSLLKKKKTRKKQQEQVCSENTCGPSYRVLFSKYTKSLPHETMNDIE